MREQERKSEEALNRLYWIGLELAQAREELEELEKFFGVKPKKGKQGGGNP